MSFWEIFQTVLLIILVDRQLILRDRYKIAVEVSKPSKYNRGWFAIWIYCKAAQDEFYHRAGGRRLLFFYFGKQIKS